MHSCKQCSIQFEITDQDRAFYKKMDVPEPTWCPQCRFRRRMMWANLRTLYERDVDGKKRISMYSPDKQLNVVSDETWWADDYDMLHYGQEYDFKSPFFVQFRTLFQRAPLPHLQRNYATFENSNFANAGSNIKNCYLIAAADYTENCAYCYTIENCKDSFDLLFVNKSELCYDGVNLTNCYKCFYSQDCEDCFDLILSRDCIGCNNCFGCVNLKNKSYYILNKPYSKEEYSKKIESLNLHSNRGFEYAQKEVEKFFLTQPRQFMHSRNVEDVSGDYIYQAKNVHHAFIASKAEHCKFVHHLRYVTAGTTNAYDYSLFGVGAELMYESVWCGLSIYNIKFSAWNYGGSNLEYCFGCHASQDCFGCVGVRHKQYCILNKQYAKEEYHNLVAKIKDHMNVMPYVDGCGVEYKYGEFFPVEFAPYCYNETIAQDFIPLSQHEAKSLGYSWKEGVARDISHEVHWSDLPDTAQEAEDSLVGLLILCKAYEDNMQKAFEHNCTKLFKIIPQELAFYKKNNLPLPRYCFNSRHAMRIGRINKFNIYHRQCMCSLNNHGHHADGTRCANEFETTYAPERPEKVFCEQCYLKEVV